MATVLVSAALTALLAAACAFGARGVRRWRSRRDAGGRRRAAVAASYERYVLATSAGGVGVWDWKLETGEIYLDPFLKRMLGFDDADVPNRIEAWMARVHPKDREASRAVAYACAEGRSDAYAILRRMVHKDGSVRWFQSRGAVVRDAAGRAARLVGTDTDVTDRKRADDAARERHAIVRADHDRARRLAGRLIAAAETERRHLARELQDDISRQLAVLLLDIDRLTSADARPSTDTTTLGHLAARAAAVAGDIHRLSCELLPPRLEAIGVVAAVDALCRDVRRHSPVVVEFHHQRVPRDLDDDVALCLYRVVQEGLHNTVKHSGATRASIDMSVADDTLELRIADQGCGFDASRVPAEALGLASMRERVRFVGGRIVIHAAPGLGTRIGVRLKIRPSRVVEMPRRAFALPRAARC